MSDLQTVSCDFLVTLNVEFDLSKYENITMDEIIIHAYEKLYSTKNLANRLELANMELVNANPKQKLPQLGSNIIQFKRVR